MDAASGLLGTAAAPAWAGGGVPWWQGVGALLAVFALLILVLRLLGRWQAGGRRRDVRLLAVVTLGRGRELQILRLREQVHYVYRQDGGLVLLESQPYAAYRDATPLVEPAGAPRLGAIWRRTATLLSGDRDQAPAGTPPTP
jgi:hypothetical protein